MTPFHDRSGGNKGSVSLNVAVTNEYIYIYICSSETVAAAALIYGLVVFHETMALCK